MLAALRTRVTAVWAVLVLATLASWLLGTESGSGSSGHRLASVIILMVALFKVRLVGLYFMELRNAPLLLRGILEGYCIAACALTISLFLLA
jgi:caa(3)-type oxidase subunit IV